MLKRTVLLCAAVVLSVVLCLGEGPSITHSLGTQRLLPATAGMQGRVRRDPLTDVETDALRDTAQEPEKRLKLFIKFAAGRLEAADQLRADPKAGKDRGVRIHDLLEDFTNIVDELDENIEDYDHRDTDLRKALKPVIEGDTEFQLKLRAWKETGRDAADSKSKSDANSDAKEYEFVLDDATESVNSSLSTARTVLQEQNRKFENKKKK